MAHRPESESTPGKYGTFGARKLTAGQENRMLVLNCSGNLVLRAKDRKRGSCGEKRRFELNRNFEGVFFRYEVVGDNAGLQ